MAERLVEQTVADLVGQLDWNLAALSANMRVVDLVGHLVSLLVVEMAVHSVNPMVERKVDSKV